MKRRIEALERTTAEETARWLQSLSDEELADLLAGRWPVQGGV